MGKQDEVPCLVPGKGGNMTNAESADWMNELARRKKEGLPMDRPPGYYEKSSRSKRSN